MKDEKKLDAILERFYNSYNKYNTKVLEELGNVIKQFDGLTPSQAHKLGQELKYSNNVDKLLNELSKISGKSIQDIDTLLDKVAEENVEFSEIYYEVKGKDYIPYEKNDSLRRYVETIKMETMGTFINLSKQKNIGFTTKWGNGTIFKPLENVYRDLIDEAVFNVSTGVADYQKAMRNTIKQLADSGIKVNEEKTTYESGYTRRIDSSVRQAILTGVKKINLGVQEKVGKDFGADGWEIDAHSPCADDHLDTQGKQFSEEEFNNLNSEGEATSYDGELVDIKRYTKKGRMYFRPVSELNCTHFAYAIVLGVSLPSYSNKMLKEYRENSLEEIEYKGRKYTRYEATQIQRRMETEIRRQKDRQIIARASGDKDEIQDAQRKITQLTKEYNNFSNASGLDTYKNRLVVSGYKRVKI